MNDPQRDSPKRKSSSSIRLVLIGSAFILAGCDRNRSSTTQPSNTGYHSGGTHWYSSGRSGSSRSAGTARGGFGASGHAAGA